jgi:hypothetical protein
MASLMVTINEVRFDALTELSQKVSTGRKIYLVLRTGSNGIWSQSVKSRDHHIDKTGDKRIAYIGETFALTLADPTKDTLVVLIHDHAHQLSTLGKSSLFGQVAVAVSSLIAEGEKKVKLEGGTFSLELTCAAHLPQKMSSTEDSIRSSVPVDKHVQ